MPEPAGRCARGSDPGRQNEKGELSFAFQGLAEWTGLEPATPGVTGRYSNQLNYHSLSCTSVPLVGAEGLEPPTFAL
jgi:hypothetical protein